MDSFPRKARSAVSRSARRLGSTGSSALCDRTSLAVQRQAATDAPATDKTVARCSSDIAFTVQPPLRPRRSCQPTKRLGPRKSRRLLAPASSPHQFIAARLGRCTPSPTRQWVRQNRRLPLKRHRAFTNSITVPASPLLASPYGMGSDQNRRPLLKRHRL